jgi:hypothetical protein
MTEKVGKRQDVTFGLVKLLVRPVGNVMPMPFTERRDDFYVASSGKALKPEFRKFMPCTSQP